MKFEHFQDTVDDILVRMKNAPLVHPPRWQSTDVSDKPWMATYELLNYSFGLNLPTEDLDFYRKGLKPNLPWADDHFFKERVGGDPLNPGQEWRNWPGAKSADTHRRGEIFDHSYAERYWPKYAGKTEGGILDTDFPDFPKHRGIRFDYGDLNDLVTTLANEPLTRQAYLPVWFPEDLQACIEKKRVPCSLGYHFIMRNDELHIIYYLRSCDFVRHFRDDVYMTIRLLLWVLEQCRLTTQDHPWDNVKTGTLTMHMTSLHIFKADYPILFKEER